MNEEPRELHLYYTGLQYPALAHALDDLMEEFSRGDVVTVTITDKGSFSHARVVHHDQAWEGLAATAHGAVRQAMTERHDARVMEGDDHGT